MSFDFYAEFWDEDKVNTFIKDFMRSTWEDIWQDRSIDFERKKKEFQKRMINNLLNELYRDFVGVEWKDSTVTYAKFLKEMETYLGPRIEDLNRFAKSELRRKRGKKEYMQISNEIVKETHKENLKKYSTIRDIESLLSLGILDYKISDSPPYSVHISVVFTLKKPYISRDDEEFYVIDNPICKDKIFKVPLVRASSWKGALRWVLMKIKLIDSDSKSKEYYVQERIKQLRLFGNEKDSKFLDDLFKQKLGEGEGEDAIKKFNEEAKRYVSEDGNRGGRLVFYPAFLNLIGLDIIAPHDRRTRTVKVPIQFEITPKNAKGTFSLLYFPFDLLGRDEEDAKEEVKQDLEVLKESIPAMLTKYGFGAKTTAGYGVVKKDIEFQILPGMNEKAKDEHFGEEESVFAREMDELIEKYGEKHEQRKN